MSAAINRLGTKVYKIIAARVAKEFARLDCVRGVYLVRGLAKDDIVFGRSDIDLTILIDEFNDAFEERQLVYELSKIYRRLKKRIPVLGEIGVYNLPDLVRRYSYRNYRFISDGKLVPLCGVDIELPDFELTEDDILYEISMMLLFFLPMVFGSKNLKNSVNVLLEISMLCHYLTGKIDRLNLKKTEILELLLSWDPESEELRRIRWAFSTFFVGRSDDLRKWIYKQCLILGDRLGEIIPDKLEGEIGGSEIHSLFCPSFRRRKYLVLNSPTEDAMETGLERMRKEPGLVMMTANILKLYLYYCYPWEYYTIRNKNPSFGLSEPSPSYMERYFLMQINRQEIRFLSNQYLLLWDVRNLVAQARLYCDHNIICVDKSDLLQQYCSKYGIWPYTGSTSLDDYFLHDYPVLWKSTGELYRCKG